MVLVYNVERIDIFLFGYIAGILPGSAELIIMHQIICANPTFFFWGDTNYRL